MTSAENDRIADPLDRAAAETENMIAVAAAYRKPVGPLANGECHNCGALLEADLRWCNKACCEDWEADQKKDAERD